MTLDKAIVGLEDLLVDDLHFAPESRKKAVKMGIEALKRIKYLREKLGLLGAFDIPGETEE